jgi:hypothetical protein
MNRDVLSCTVLVVTAVVGYRLTGVTTVTVADGGDVSWPSDVSGFVYGEMWTFQIDRKTPLS